jgi:predicted Zn-dependent peptidase
VAELVEVVVAEIRRLKQESLPGDELRRAKDHLKGSLMLNLESTSSRMSHHARQEIYRDRADGLDEMLAAIEAVSVDDVRRLATEFFAPDALGVTVLGDVNGLSITREQLRID